MIFGRLVFAGWMLASGLAGAQLPELAQQYRQRLGGAVDELRTIVTRFETDAKSEGLDSAAALERHRANQDELIRKRGIAMAETIARFTRLSDQEVRLKEDNTLLRVTTMLAHGDRDIVSAAMRDFSPAVPINAEGGFFAAVGAFFGWLALRLFTWPKRSFDRWLAYRRYYRR
ncbi:MAG TPA: DUF2937 family protein [Beijerinckiaceae bacterium]|nr:DUF2937 family protein [Beijerinckiaceae bacterium]